MTQFEPEAEETRLPEEAEALLKAWPSVERDEEAWRTQADVIVAKARSTKPGSTSDALLEPPLPVQSGEGRAVGEAATGGSSLAELARAVVAKRTSTDRDELAKESLAVAAAARPNVAEPHTAERPETQPTRPLTIAARNQRARWIGGGIVVLGLAAALLLKIGQQPAEPPTAKVDAPAKLEKSSEVSQPPAVEPGGIRLQDVPGAEVDESTPSASPAPSVAKTTPKKPIVPSGTSAAEQSATEPKRGSDTLDPVQNMRPALGPDSLPDKPSTGAVEAALASTLMSARSCLTGQRDASEATIVFGHDGFVRSVSVTGPAAGTPADGCIRERLSKSRVQPFAKPTFSVRKVIRPL